MNSVTFFYKGIGAKIVQGSNRDECRIPEHESFVTPFMLSRHEPFNIDGQNDGLQIQIRSQQNGERMPRLGNVNGNGGILKKKMKTKIQQNCLTN